MQTATEHCTQLLMINITFNRPAGGSIDGVGVGVTVDIDVEVGVGGVPVIRYKYHKVYNW